MTTRAQGYAADYEYALAELRKGAYHTYGVIHPPHGNVDAVKQAEKDYKFEVREREDPPNPRRDMRKIRENINAVHARLHELGYNSLTCWNDQLRDAVFWIHLQTGDSLLTVTRRAAGSPHGAVEDHRPTQIYRLQEISLP